MIIEDRGRLFGVRFYSILRTYELHKLRISNFIAFDENNKKTRQYPVFKGSMLLGVGKKHPKANQKTIESKELQHEKIIFLSEEPSSVALNGMIENCRADGYEPCVIEKVSTLETLILLVELHRGVAFFPNMPQVTQDDRISYLSITNSPHQFQIVVDQSETSTILPSVGRHISLDPSAIKVKPKEE